MFSDEELALIAEMVEDRTAHYEKLLREARWAQLKTTEQYLQGRLDRLKSITDKVRVAQHEKSAEESKNAA